MAPDIIIDDTPLPARIRLVGKHGYASLWVENGYFHVTVRLTPAATRALGEQLLAQVSPKAGPPPSQAGRPAAAP